MNAAHPPRRDGPAILIIDDVYSNVSMLADYLGAHGFSVMVAQDGEEGIERAQFGQPDLILLDVMMPGIDGFEACRRLKACADTQDIPVIFMTALAETSDKITAYSAGGVDYVTKPFQMEEVLARVNTHLALQAIRKQLAMQNRQLQQEIAVREQAEAALRRAHDELEERVAQRTAELARANASLQAENSERKLAEEALRAGEARMRRLVESNIVGILFYDLAGNITDANDAALAMIGYNRQDLLSGKIRWPDMTPPEWRAADARAVEALKATGTCRPFEKEYVRKDGSRVPVLIAAAMFDGPGEQGLAFALDLTERKQAEDALHKAHDDLELRVLERTSELQQSNRQLACEVLERQEAQAVLAQRSQELARSNAELEQLAYVASHDLQEPLRMVASYLQLLEQQYTDQLDADAHEFIGYAVDGAKRMQALIDDLLTYSRVASRAKPLQPTDCNAVLETALHALRVAIEESGAQVQCGVLPVVLGDAAQLAQLFQNLIANAIKFHGQQAPKIAVWAEPEDAFWRFAVQDNGIGIAPEYFERIFVMFQRLHSHSTYPGTGIGLAICKKIVEQHGGRIWVESAPQGAVFKFTLPQMTAESHAGGGHA